MIKKLGAAALILSVLIPCLPAFADGFKWTVNCQFVDGLGQTNYWVGYSSDEALRDSWVAYIGNGPGFEMNTPLKGTFEKQVDVLLPESDSRVTLFLYPQDVDITISADTVAPDCDAPPDVATETPPPSDDILIFGPEFTSQPDSVTIIVP